MKLSSRKQLLKEARITLKSLRETINEAPGDKFYFFYADVRFGNNEWKNSPLPDFIVMAPSLEDAAKQIQGIEHYANRYGGWQIYSAERSNAAKFLKAIKDQATFWDNGIQQIQKIFGLTPGKVVAIENVYQSGRYDALDLLHRED